MNRVFVLLAICILLILSLLSFFYLANYLWFFAILIPIVLALIIIIFSIMIFLKYIKTNKYFLFRILFIPVVTAFISVAIVSLDASFIIAESIELKLDKSKLSQILDGIYKGSDYQVDRNLYSFRFGTGITDNWSSIIYDDTGLLDSGIFIINSDIKYYDSTSFMIIKSLFGGDLYSISKIQEHWYLCHFT